MYIRLTEKTSAELAQYTPERLEIVYVTDTGRLATGDGLTLGGRMLALLSDVGVEPETVATPTFSPSSGTSFASTQAVTIACATSGAAIYYTTNGSTPSEASTLYSGAITLSATTTVKAIGVKSGMTTSAVGLASYTKTSTIYYGASTSTTLDEAGITGLDDSVEGSTPAGTYVFDAPGLPAKYLYFAWPTSLAAQPVAGTGFAAFGFPMDMAGSGEGYTEAEDGWGYKLVSVGGVQCRLYRTTNALEEAFTVNVTAS